MRNSIMTFTGSYESDVMPKILIKANDLSCKKYSPFLIDIVDSMDYNNKTILFKIYCDEEGMVCKIQVRSVSIKSGKKEDVKSMTNRRLVELDNYYSPLAADDSLDAEDYLFFTDIRRELLMRTGKLQGADGHDIS